MLLGHVLIFLIFAAPGIVLPLGVGPIGLFLAWVPAIVTTSLFVSDNHAHIIASPSPGQLRRQVSNPRNILRGIPVAEATRVDVAAPVGNDARAVVVGVPVDENGSAISCSTLV